MKKILVSVLSILTAACSVKHIQSPDEFVSHYAGGPGMGKKISNIKVDRSYKSVLSTLERYSRTCINDKVIVSTLKQGMYISRTETEYRVKISKKSDSSSFLSVQGLYNGAPPSGAPADGIYLLVSEIKSGGASKTLISTYYIWGKEFENITYYLNEWASGNTKDCPNLAT